MTTKSTRATSWLGFALFALAALVAFAFPHPASAMSLLALGSQTTATTDITEAMKIIFSDPLVNNIVTDSELLSVFVKDSRNIQSDQTTGGRWIEMAHYFQLPAGVGFRAESDYIPVPNSPAFKNSKVYLRKMMGSVEMTGDTMRKVKGDEGAFINYMERALPDLSERVVSEVDRAALWFGYGIKARTTQALQGGGSPYTVVVDRSGGVTGLTDPWLQFLEGESIVFSATAAGTALRNAGANQALTITDIAPDTNTITGTAAAGLAAVVLANDYIFAGDASGSSSQNAGVDREMQGLFAGIDDGNILDTYNNIQRTAAGNRLWQSVIVDSSASPWEQTLTEDLLTYADEVCFVRGKGKPDLFVMSRSAARSYWKSLKSQQFFPDPRGQFTGGKDKDGLTIRLADRTATLKVARKIPPQVVFGVQTDTWKRLTLNEWEWDDTTGAIWNRVTDGTGRKDAFYAVGFMYEELACMAPRKNLRIDNLLAVS